MPPSNPFETLPEAEAAQIEEIAKLTVELLDRRYGDARILRAVHPKSHGCVNGFFEIRQDVPKDLQVGLFARPGTRYQAWVPGEGDPGGIRHSVPTPTRIRNAR